MPASKKRRSEAIDGILLLNKPAGMTSNRALQTVRRLLNARKAGHTGSLDPAATGMLPLCFGEATKVCAFLLDADKAYRVTARLGSATETGDADGKSVSTAGVPALERGQWQEILQGFIGESMQVPPMYSALKKDGKRLYELARKGEEVEREPRPIRVDEIDLLEAAGSRLVFRVRCSKGTYVRTLVEDIAAKAGTLAHTERLHREFVAGFEQETMLGLDEVEARAADSREALLASLLPADRALVGMPAVKLPGAVAERFCAGMAVAALPGSEAGLARVYAGDNETDFLGVGEVAAGGELAPRRVFARR